MTRPDADKLKFIRRSSINILWAAEYSNEKDVFRVRILHESIKAIRASVIKKEESDFQIIGIYKFWHMAAKHIENMKIKQEKRATKKPIIKSKRKRKTRRKYPKTRKKAQRSHESYQAKTPEARQRQLGNLCRIGRSQNPINSLMNQIRCEYFTINKMLRKVGIKIPRSPRYYSENRKPANRMLRESHNYPAVRKPANRTRESYLPKTAEAEANSLANLQPNKATIKKGIA